MLRLSGAERGVGLRGSARSRTKNSRGAPRRVRLPWQCSGLLMKLGACWLAGPGIKHPRITAATAASTTATTTVGGEGPAAALVVGVADRGAESAGVAEAAGVAETARAAAPARGGAPGRRAPEDCTPWCGRTLMEGAVAACPECCGGGVGGVRLVLAFFEGESRARLEEAREGDLKRKKRTQVAKLVVKPAKNRQDESLVGDWLVDIAQRIGQGLELGAVVVHAHVALRSVAELGVEGEGAASLVVAEEVVDGEPNLARGGAGGHDDAEQLRGDGAVDPVEDGEVVAPPCRCGRGVGGGVVAGDVGGEAVAA